MKSAGIARLSSSLCAASWRFRESGTRGWLPARIPGCVHTDLRNAGQIPDPFFGTNELDLQWIEDRDWEYRTQFRVPPELLEREIIELVADGLDTVATVICNGRLLARTDNMFVGHRWGIRPLLRSGRNELAVRFHSAMDYVRHRRRLHRPTEFNDPVGRGSVIRKQPSQFGWDWGPRLVTAGIWRDLRLEAWSRNRLDSVRVRQDHPSAGKVILHLTPELARPERHARLRWRLGLHGAPLQEGEGRRIVITRPERWWPAGQGAQPLYELTVELLDDQGQIVDRWQRRIGLRTIVLDRRPDRWGEAFGFVVNGRRIFCKGANWVPAHAFVTELTRADYAARLEAAAAAHMNMLRVWGGGIYESEDFFDRCDELGLLVWHDFMFACTRYPGDRAFTASVRDEARQQVRRLRHRACLGLWCGNNEVAKLNLSDLGPRSRHRRDYTTLFHRILPTAVARHDGATAYWPTSEWRGDFAEGHDAGERRGDTHFWDVWHARHPVKSYERWKFRFVSEFGMQSFSSLATNRTFCPAGDTNVFGPAMENHQKNRAGNQIILDYVSRRYRFPRSEADLIYLSQLNQAHCMQVGVEHYRRNSPRCRGTLYWQLNDCWPVTGWSSLEFSGRWKALHYAARRFYAPRLVTAHVPGEESTTIGNYRRSTVRHVHLHTVCDAPDAAAARLRWQLLHFDGRSILAGGRRLQLTPGRSQRHLTLDLASPLQRHGREHLYLRIALDCGGHVASEQSVFLAPPRFLALPKAKIRTTVRPHSPTSCAITFLCGAFQSAVEFDLQDFAFSATDNFFDLYPDEPRTVTVKLSRPAGKATIAAALVCRSLADTYS